MFKQTNRLRVKNQNQKLIDVIESLTAKVSEILINKSDAEGLKLQMAEITNQSSRPAEKLMRMLSL